MAIRNLILIGSLAIVLGGCVVAPHPQTPRGYYDDRDYRHDYYYSDDDYYDYHATPAYQGYYYVRVIFIGNVPYYVGDDRRVRPIPPHLHDHFRKSPYRNSDRRAPVFSRDREVRDGYPMARIIYLNDVPHYVDEKRMARPLPNHMHQRFRPSPFNQRDGRGNGDRQEGQRRSEPPRNGRERERESERERAQPAYGREWERERDDDRQRRSDTPASVREREEQRAPRNGVNGDTRQREERRTTPGTADDNERPLPPAKRDERRQPPFSRDERQQPAPATRNGPAARDTPPASNGGRPTTQPPRSGTAKEKALEKRKEQEKKKRVEEDEENDEKTDKKRERD